MKITSITYNTSLTQNPNCTELLERAKEIFNEIAKTQSIVSEFSSVEQTLSEITIALMQISTMKKDMIEDILFHILSKPDPNIIEKVILQVFSASQVVSSLSKYRETTINSDDI